MTLTTPNFGVFNGATSQWTLNTTRIPETSSSYIVELEATNPNVQLGSMSMGGFNFSCNVTNATFSKAVFSMGDTTLTVKCAVTLTNITGDVSISITQFSNNG